MSQIVVDTDVASYIFNWHSLAQQYADALRGSELILSFMTIAELRMGAILSTFRNSGCSHFDDVDRRNHPYITAAPSSAVKYAQSGWWKTSALTLASGSIIMPSVSRTPISSGRSSWNRPRWSSIFGQAG